MTYADLATFAQLSVPAQRVAESFWPDLEFTDVVGSVALHLRVYAVWKADAMRARESGAIRAAQGLEAECDNVYKRLPAWARW